MKNKNHKNTRYHRPPHHSVLKKKEPKLIMFPEKQHEQEHSVQTLALFKADNQKPFLISANEAAFLENAMKLRDKNKDQDPNTFFEHPINLTADDENGPFFVAYGVIIPQYGRTDWDEEAVEKELEHFKSTYLQHLGLRKTPLDSYVYADFHTDYDHRYFGHIPVALLMCSSKPIEEIKERAAEPHSQNGYLGSVISPYFDGLNVADSMINRSSLIIIRDVEETFTGDKENWKSCINPDKLAWAASNLR